MKRFGIEALLNPASLPREMALLALGFRLTERSPERIGATFWHTKGVHSVARLIWVAEHLAHLFWQQFLPSGHLRVENVEARLKSLDGAQPSISFFLEAFERETLLQSLRATERGFLVTRFLVRSAHGLVLGEITIEMHSRQSVQLLAGQS